MKLSELVFNVVKNVKYMSDTEFTLDAFRQGDFDDDLDYANSINNAFLPINEAIHRLSDLGKIRHRIVSTGVPSSTGTIDFSGLEEVIEHPIKEILSVFIYSKNGDNYLTFPFREVSEAKVKLVNATVPANYAVYMEYVEDMKWFSKEDYDYSNYDAADESSYTDVELKDYGISNTMASYIMEYSKGVLFEPIAPEIANMHITRAEQYFSDLPEQQTSFYQKEINKTYRI